MSNLQEWQLFFVEFRQNHSNLSYRVAQRRAGKAYKENRPSQVTKKSSPPKAIKSPTKQRPSSPPKEIKSTTSERKETKGSIFVVENIDSELNWDQADRDAYKKLYEHCFPEFYPRELKPPQFIIANGKTDHPRDWNAYVLVAPQIRTGDVGEPWPTLLPVKSKSEPLSGERVVYNIDVVCTHLDARKQGLAERLLTRALSEIRQRHAAWFAGSNLKSAGVIDIQVFDGNVGAKYLYLKHGFVPRTSTPRDNPFTKKPDHKLGLTQPV